MRILTLTLLVLFSFSFLHAQNDEDMEDSRKGAYFLEAGYNIFGGSIASSGTGFTSIAGENDETLTAFGFEGGRFMTENLALKFRLGGLTVGDSNNSNSIGSLGIGGKYYIKGKVPIELMFVSIDEGNDDDLLVTSLIIAYAFTISDNTYLELGVGGLGSSEDGDEGIAIFKMSFTMVL